MHRIAILVQKNGLFLTARFLFSAVADVNIFQLFPRDIRKPPYQRNVRRITVSHLEPREKPRQVQRNLVIKRSSLAKRYKFKLTTPIKDLSEEARNALLYGTGGEKLSLHYQRERGTGTFSQPFEGIVNNL
ncbi:MAG: hypothetical protein II574_05065, partial [Ruminococcus sp.]|nr:hypothetical protein [Ruminococcus sp.]